MPGTVLLADDHALVREGLKRLLARAGFSAVAEAKDGGEALQKAEELRPGIL
jgi:two component transcriptional regulator, LuxR family